MTGLAPELIEWRTQGKFIKVPPLDLRVFYREIGDRNAPAARTLLMLHGFPESSFSFHKVIDAMLAEFDRLILLDLPGYGFSDKPGIEYSYSLVPQAEAALTVWRHLGVEGGHIISHDMGTSVLTELLARHVSDLLPGWFTDAIQSATFTNGSMVLSMAKLRLMQKLLLNSKVGPVISANARFSLFRNTVKSAHGLRQGEPGALSDNDINLLWQSCTERDGHTKNHHIIRYLNDRRRFESTRWLPALRLADKALPIHFCWGDADQVARIEMAEFLHRDVCPNSGLTRLPGVGHFCQLGSPEAWINGVSAFYRQLSN